MDLNALDVFQMFRNISVILLMVSGCSLAIGNPVRLTLGSFCPDPNIL